MAEVKWTPDKIEILKLYYGKESVKEIQKRLPDMTEQTIYVMANKLNLSKKTSNWTPDKIEILKQYYGTETAEELTKRLPDFTADAIRTKAKLLKITKKAPSWTAEEDEIIKQNYIAMKPSVLVKLLPGRTTYAVSARLSYLGLSHFKVEWSDEEIEKLKKFFPTDTTKQIMERFPNRSYKTISEKAKELNLVNDHAKNKWTEEEVEILKKYHSKETLEQLAKRLPGRVESSISMKAKSLGLTKDFKIWTEEEVEILKKNYGTESMKELIKRLPDRNENTIRSKAKSLGLSRKRNSWTLEEDEILKKYHSKETFEQLAKRLPNKSLNAIKSRLKILFGKQESIINLDENISLEHADVDKEYVETQSLTITENSIQEITVIEVEGEADTIEHEETPKEKEAEDNIGIVISNDSLNCKKAKTPNQSKNKKVNNNNKKHVIPKRKSAWTEDEDEIVKEYFIKESIGEIMKRLPNHTKNEIKSRAKKLKVVSIDIKPENWDDKDIDILKEYYPTEGTAVFLRLKKYSLNSIRIAVKKLGLKVNRIYEPWTEQEDYLACEYYLSHLNDWNKRESIEELHNIFISNGFTTHGKKTIHMKLANCAYIHTGYGLEHASEQNIKVYNKLTGGNLFTRFFRWLRRVFKI